MHRPSVPLSISLSIKCLRKCYRSLARSELESSRAYTVRSSIVIPKTGDITFQSSLASISSSIRAEVGYINVLIANAGAMGPMLKDLKPRHTLSDFVAFAQQTPMQEFTDTYALNCTATYYTVLAFLELLDEGNKARYQGGKARSLRRRAQRVFCEIRGPGMRI